MHREGPLRSVTNTASTLGYAPLASTHPPLDTKAALLMANVRGMQNSVFGAPSGTMADGPAAKRPRVEDVLQHQAPREQLLVSELMGWRSSQEPSTGFGNGAASGVPSGSTNFSALFARQSSLMQPPPQPRAPSAATNGLRTFADVATRPAMGPDDVGRQDVLGAMRAVYSTAGVSTCSTGLGRSASQHAWPAGDPPNATAASDGVAAGAGPATGAGTLEGLTLDTLPVDWGIKRSITFTSSAPFGVHQRAQQAPPRTRWRAMQNVINCDMESCSEEAVHYLASQLSWRHPEMPLDPGTLAAARAAAATAPAASGAGGAIGAPATGATGTAGGGGLLSKRLVAWRSALHSLYGTYRGGDCSVFYVINTASRNPFVALFAARGVRGSSELTAVVSQSSRLLRGRMLAAGVPFTMPLEAPQGGAGGAGPGGQSRADAAGLDPDEAEDAELCNEGRQAAASSAAAQVPGAAVPDNSRESLLLLRGPRAVHGLYDFLMNETTYSGSFSGSRAGGAVRAAGGPADELSDLPVLLAPSPFEGGAVWRPTVKTMTMSRQVAGDNRNPDGPFGHSAAGGGADQDTAGAVHVLQVSGLLAPWAVRRMCGALAALHPAGYTATVEAEPCSIPLNSRVIEARAGGADAEEGAAPALVRQQELQAVFPHGGALSVAELKAWQQPVVLPGGRPVKGVTCSGGDSRRMSVRL